MLARSILVGIVEIDTSAGKTFLSGVVPRRRGISSGAWREGCADFDAYAVLMADLPRLREELDSDFRRLQARLAA
jgi:hypothetical protein